MTVLMIDMSKSLHHQTLVQDEQSHFSRRTPEGYDISHPIPGLDFQSEVVCKLVFFIREFDNDFKKMNATYES